MKAVLLLCAIAGMLSAIVAEAHIQRRSVSSTVDSGSIYARRIAARQYKYRPHKLVTRQDGVCPAPLPVPSARAPSCGNSGCSYCDGACVDYIKDENNCGACGDVCAEGDICYSGVCTAPCTETELGTGSCSLSLLSNGGFQSRNADTGNPDPWDLGTTNPSGSWGYNTGGHENDPDAHVFWRGDGGVLSQSTAAVAGRRYTLSFNSATRTDSESYTIRFGDLEVTLHPTTEWIRYSYTATALGNDVLTFTGIGGQSDGDLDFITLVEAA